MQNLNHRISSLIVKQVKSRNLKQNILAEILSVTPACISGKISGSRSWKVSDLQLLANAGFDFSDLFTREA